MTSDAAQVLASPNETNPPVVRVATVLADPPPSAVYVSVRITSDGTVMRIPFQAPYVPVPGDQVNVLLIPGSGNTFSGIVLGGRAGQSGNRVLNGNFDVLGDGEIAMPPNWYHYRASGPGDSFVRGQIATPGQQPLMHFNVNSAGASDNYAHGASIPVSPGQVYRAGMSGRVDFIDGASTVTISLIASWFSNDQTLYPDVAASNTVINSLNTNVIGDFAFPLTNFTVPANISHMRIGVRVNPSAGGTGCQVFAYSVQAFRN